MSTQGSEPVSVGDVIAGKYRIERLIGQRGVGLVVRAEHIGLKHPVAMKILRASPSPEHDERFLREARAAATIPSEHIVRVLDMDRLPTGEPYLVMELLDGVPLDEHLAHRGPLPVPTAVAYLLHACEAVARAHAAGIVHRELKPGNLFLTRDERGAECVKVLDFGMCKLDPATQGSARGWYTGATMLVGSPNHMAPEQWGSAAKVDGRCDIWALGAILYELLAGRPAFSGPDLAAIGTAVQQREPPSLAALRPDVPAEIVGVVARCLRKAAAERFRSAFELGKALAPWAGPVAQAVVTELRRQFDPEVSSARLAVVSVPNLELVTGAGSAPPRGDLGSAPTMSVGGPTVHDPAVAEVNTGLTPPPISSGTGGSVAAWPTPPPQPTPPPAAGPALVAPTMSDWAPPAASVLPVSVAPSPVQPQQPYPTPSYYPPVGAYPSAYPPSTAQSAPQASPLPWLLAGFATAIALVAVAIVLWLVL